MKSVRLISALILVTLCLAASPAVRAEDQPTPSPTASAASATAPSITFPLTIGDHGYLVSMAQRRLTWLGAQIREAEISSASFGPSTRKAVRAFQVKFFGRQHGRIGKVTWDALSRIAGRVGTLPQACTEETSLCIDMRQRLLRYVDGGKVLLTLDARFGMPGYSTARGTFAVRSKSRNHVSSKYHTWMPYAMFFNGGQAVHYSPYFDRDGYSGGSHGCVNIRDIKRAAWLFDRIPIGTRVHLYA